MYNNLALFTDLYELTMLQAYYNENLNDNAVFSLFVRRLPRQRNYLLACGLEDVLSYLENLRFLDEDIKYLSSLDKFSRPFLDWLKDFRFTGSVYAVDEGTPVFADEPILEIEAPLPQAQIIETYIMNQVHLQTLLATKSQRVAMTAGYRAVVDFGSRRNHGIDAALKGARAFYIGGVASTSNVLAGKMYDIPVAGTMAHSYIQAHPDEYSALKAFVKHYPDTVLLVDTYDTLEGIRKLIRLSREPGGNFRVKSVRLDSGDLADLSKKARELLDEAGLEKVGIFASGGLDEYRIKELLDRNAPIDGFGVGTSMGVSEDVPSLEIAYKLCEYSGTGRLKLSPGKPILPGRKQVFRQIENDCAIGDTISSSEEDLPGRALLHQVMDKGTRLHRGKRTLEEARATARKETALLPDKLKDISVKEDYPVRISKKLSSKQKQLEKELEEK